jgi:hypothetical protein
MSLKYGVDGEDSVQMFATDLDCGTRGGILQIDRRGGNKLCGQDKVYFPVVLI